MLEVTEKPAAGVTAQYQDRPARRVILTPPALNAARTVIFLVTGVGKAETLHAVLKGPYQPHVLPAQLVRPDNGHVLWLVDEAAGCKIRQLT
jgi:6-phosphogluconolactonase